jgi:Ca2+-transporting ATPase
MNWHLLSIPEIEQQLGCSPNGLESSAISERLLEYGKNQIEDQKKKSILKILLRQFADFMILVLLASAVISGLLGDLTDTIIIFAIIIVNAIVGFVQEYRAEKTMEALKSMTTANSKVIRSAQTLEILVTDLVPGDLLLLEAGNIIPADVRFLKTFQLKVDESALTGESQNIEKNSEVLPAGEYALGDRINIGFKGTNVTNGRALAYVAATGMNTELGRIARMIQSEKSTTPLQKRLASFGKRLSVVILIICMIVFILGWLRGENALVMLLTSISLAVAAIPEALPALVTIALAFGAKRLVENNALIRKLPAVETLGSVTYICTDKTGTLTLNKMTVQECYEAVLDDSITTCFENSALFSAMALNNDVIQDKDQKWLGDSTEVALVQYAFERNFERVELEKGMPRIAELPFDSTRKCMTTLHQYGDNVIAITKGAVDVLFSKLDQSQQITIPEFEKKADQMAEKGYRVLGYAVKWLQELPQDINADSVESSLQLLGFVGMIDPPRTEAIQAVFDCKQAGIIPVMITGDHKLTATAIAKKIGIISENSNLVITGLELSNLSEIEFENCVEKVRVYARVNPEQKLKIVKALQAKNQFVAMTGDGVNDAPALKNADIGIAMGINGTEVSKEASHMILLDDNFATIVVAVKHGRRIFDNILKFIKYTMTSNSGEIWVIFLAPFFLLPIPLLAVHILWINLVTDGLPGLALASEPAEENIMKRKPRNPKKNIFAGDMARHILWVGLLMGLISLGMQAWAIQNKNMHWQTMVFTVLCFSQMGHVMAIRSERESLFKIGLFTNKPLLGALLLTVILQLGLIYIPFFNPIFRTAPLSLVELAITIVVSSVVFWAVELEKWLKRKRKNSSEKTTPIL